MNDHPVHRDDVTALRREGDLSGYIRSLIRPTGTRGTATPPAPRTHDRPPGAWPQGSSPPGPPPERNYPKHLWDAAVRHYSNTEHRPDQPCDCGNCPDDDTARDQQTGDTE